MNFSFGDLLSKILLIYSFALHSVTDSWISRHALARLHQVTGTQSHVGTAPARRAISTLLMRKVGNPRTSPHRSTEEGSLNRRATGGGDKELDGEQGAEVPGSSWGGHCR